MFGLRPIIAGKLTSFNKNFALYSHGRGAKKTPCLNAKYHFEQNDKGRKR